MTAYLFLAVNILLSSTGQILIKIGAQRVTYGNGIRTMLQSLVANPPAILGSTAVLFAPPFYFAALRDIELAAAYSFTGLNYVLVLLGSTLILKERVTLLHFVGVTLVMSGVAVFRL